AGAVRLRHVCRTAGGGGLTAMSAVLDFPLSAVAKPEARPYLDAFAKTEGEPEWLSRERQRALSRFAELGFPSRRSGSWRYLDLQPLQQKPLLPAEPDGGAEDSARAQLASLELPGSGPRLVLVDGRFAPELSRVGGLPKEVRFSSTRRAIAEREVLFRELTDDPAHPFAALNTAFFSDGFFLDIGAGVTLAQPLEIVHLASGHNASYHTRSLIHAGEGSRATVLEAYAGAGHYWRNDVVTVRLDTGAELTRAVLVEEAVQALHLAELDAKLGA